MEKIAIQNPTSSSDVCQSNMITNFEFDAVSQDSINNPRDSSYSSDEENVFFRTKKRVHRFSESDSDIDKENAHKDKSVLDENTDNEIDSNCRKSIVKYTLDKVDSDSDSTELQTFKNEGQQSRMESKRKKIKAKFRNLTSKLKHNNDKNTCDEIDKNSTNSDLEDISAVDKIKQNTKERLIFKPSIYDPDTSGDEADKEASHKSQKQKKPHKSILTSPKPMRISAKQALENMHKIKSESNRLLREKEVSLPYHRPKALSLKDILNRRKPAITTDGKVLPIKMNGDQLKEYALLLEQRQKEMIELCKSDTDEETEDKQAENENKINEPIVLQDGKFLNVHDNQLVENCVIHDSEIEGIEEAINTNKEESAEQNLTVDKIKIDEIIKNHDIPIDILKEHSVKETVCTDEGNLTVDHSIIDITICKENDVVTVHNSEKQLLNVDSNKDSQLISLHYDSEKSDININICEDIKEIEKDKNEEFDKCDISDNEINFDDIDKIIENSEIIEDKNSSATIKQSLVLKIKPKLTGAAGMVIDFDDSETPKKLTGLELLKDRFTYFAKLKTPDELEREREKRMKPGTQHLKLKQELEEKIAEQRSIEWAKRFEEEKQQQAELKAVRGDASDVEDDIEKIEAKLEQNTFETEESSSSAEEEEEVEEDIEMKEKIRKKNPMIDDEAEVTDCEEEDTAIYEDLNNEGNNGNERIDDDRQSDEDKNECSDNELSESENEQPTQKKGRILKAFEDDSDDENINNEVVNVAKSTNGLEEKEFRAMIGSCENNPDIVLSQKESGVIKDSQDDPIQLAQRVNSVSDDLFTSLESGALINNYDEVETQTQTFSILNPKLNEESIEINDTEKLFNTNNTESDNINLDNAAYESQTYTENFIPSQIAKTVSSSQSQPFGEDILALCTGKFYDNEFVTQTNNNLVTDNEISETLINNAIGKSDLPKQTELTNSESKVNNDRNFLQSILEDLHDSESDSKKPNKYFVSNEDNNISNTLVKKKFVIDSDEEDNDTNTKERKKRKNLRKRKPVTRALQISDDEDDEQSYEEEICEYETSDIEDDTGERVVEYDSEENEIEVKPQNTMKKRKANDFFEEEAELTSEDEWVGSGDEDERDLDRMEREEGDNDVFHQGKLQKELGQIHMRDVLDQDKREVRLIQELLFEDGDLGDGHRQRKFRWKNADGEEETGMIVEGFTDTQEEEFESEELWRKQRHEREVFLRQMENQDNSADNVNISLNRTTIIKANLCSKSMSTLLLETSSSPSAKQIETTNISLIKEKKTAANLTSPKKAFTLFQQNYHRSLLTRGQGALARLAALATPLALDDDAPKIGSLGPTNSRNFVFASVTPDDKETKVSKRKADSKADTPRLVKKLKTDEKKLYNKNSLLNHLHV